MDKLPDELYLQQALELAREGVGLASPNPCVGAVIVDNCGCIVGRGSHKYEGRKHAEILALEEARDKACGSTLYLNLEPCSHTGRTGPCADAVVAAGIARVVCSMTDPNPQVAGEGFRKLRQAGIKVEVGLYEAEAKKLNEAFAKFIRTQMPFVTLKGAMSLDGKIALPNAKHGSTSYITGKAALEKVHELRHAHDAILVGIGTVIADDPMLTDRSEKTRRRPLLRVVIDSQLRIPLNSRLVESCKNDLLIFTTANEQTKRDELIAKGVNIIALPAASSRINLAAALRALGELQILSVLVEGGSTINAEFLRAGIVDKLWLFYASNIIGSAGVPWLAESSTFAAPLRPFGSSLHSFGSDFAIESYLRDPYAADNVNL